MIAKRICHITTVHPAFDTRIFGKECLSLVKAGFDVHLVVVNGKTEVLQGIQIHGVPVNFTKRVQRITKAPKAAMKAALELDAAIYHFHDPEFIPAALKLIAKGKKVIYDVHEDVGGQIKTKYWVPKLLRNLVSGAFKKYEDYAARKMTFIVTATPWIRDRFVGYNDAVEDVNNYPILGELFRPDTDRNPKNEVAYVGGLSVIRGLIPLIQALPKTKDVRMNMIGGYSPESFAEVLRAEPGFACVNELGMKNRTEVAEILAQSVAGMVTFLPAPNHIDAQPNKMFEYMSAGIPVVASNFPLWRKIIEGNNCGICVDPEDPKAMAEAIDYLVEHKEEAKKMGKNGRAAVEEKYNWEVEERKLIAIYNRLLGINEPTDGQSK